MEALPSRLVAPLARTRLTPEVVPRALCPVFNIDGASVVLLPHEAGPHEAGPIEARLLERRTASLPTQAHDVVAALDALVSGF